MSTELEVRKVILFRAGVGWFELEGEIASESTRLFFKEKDMNDLLKTLNVELIGETESRIRAISFDSALPPEKLKESLSISISPTDSIRNLIQELVGRRIEVGLVSKKTTGTVIGEQTIQGEEQAERVYLVLRDDNGTISFLSLNEILSLNIENPDLNSDLARALDIHAAAKLKETKPISIYFTDKAAKTLRLSYLAETPAWKTSYRVYHRSEENTTTLQGWAIVDNTQQQNWDNVYLTLVTGLPITFIYDLFSPQHIQRPYVRREEVTTLRPDEIEDDFDLAKKEMAELADGFGVMREELAPHRSMAGMKATAQRGVARSESLQVAAETREVSGTYVVYDIATPVTIERNQTALVPIVQESFEGRKIRIYNPQVHAKNPLMALELKNTTGKVIEKGPFTVMLDDTYAGEGILPMLQPDDERIITFALEQAITVVKEIQEEQHEIGLDFAKKYLKKRLEALKEITYTITNKRDELVTLLVDEPKEHGYKPFGAENPKETEAYFRYEFTLPPKTTEKFHISFKRVFYTQLEKRSLNENDIVSLLKKEFISDDQTSQLYELVKLRNKKITLEREREALLKKLQGTEHEQERLRENLKALGDSVEEAKLRKRYVDKLAQQEERIEQWRQQVKTLDEQIIQAEQAFDAFLQTL